MYTFNPTQRLTLLLQLVTLHSFAVGLGLIFLPVKYLELFGFYNYTESFFQAQGGIFHIVMCVAYYSASKNFQSSSGMIYFVIIAKSMALVFLLVYFLFVESIWMILLSAIGDGLMALIIFILYKQYLHSVDENHD